MVSDPESGEIICRCCGCVIPDSNIQQSYNACNALKAVEPNDRNRIGTHVTLARYDMGLYTIIGRTDRDANGAKINTAIRYKIERLKIWDLRTQLHTPKDINLKKTFNELDRLKDKLSLSDVVVEKTAYIYGKAKEKGFNPWQNNFYSSGGSGVHCM